MPIRRAAWLLIRRHDRRQGSLRDSGRFSHNAVKQPFQLAEIVTEAHPFARFELQKPAHVGFLVLQSALPFIEFFLVVPNDFSSPDKGSGGSTAGECARERIGSATAVGRSSISVGAGNQEILNREEVVGPTNVPEGINQGVIYALKSDL